MGFAIWPQSQLKSTNESNAIIVCQLCDILSCHWEEVSYLWHYCARKADINTVKVHQWMHSNLIVTCVIYILVSFSEVLSCHVYNSNCRCALQKGGGHTWSTYLGCDDFWSRLYSDSCSGALGLAFPDPFPAVEPNQIPKDRDKFWSRWCRDHVRIWLQAVGHPSRPAGESGDNRQTVKNSPREVGCLG